MKPLLFLLVAIVAVLFALPCDTATAGDCHNCRVHPLPAAQMRMHYAPRTVYEPVTVYRPRTVYDPVQVLYSPMIKRGLFGRPYVVMAGRPATQPSPAPPAW